MELEQLKELRASDLQAEIARLRGMRCYTTHYWGGVPKSLKNRDKDQETPSGLTNTHKILLVVVVAAVAYMYLSPV